MKIEVCPYKKRESRNPNISNYYNLYIKNIPKKYTDDDLCKLFRDYGEIISAVVIKDTKVAIENKGFGFVCFKKSEDAKNAEEKLKNYKIEDQVLFVCKALPKDERKKQQREERLRIYKDCNLYVKELANEINDEMLKSAFSEFGKVVSARVMMERRESKDGPGYEIASRNFGFVCFSNKEEAKKAIMESKNRQILGRMLYVAVAEKKEDRQSKMNQPLPMQYPYGPQPGYYGPQPFFQYPMPRNQRQRGRHHPRPYGQYPTMPVMYHEIPQGMMMPPGMPQGMMPPPQMMPAPYQIPPQVQPQPPQQNPLPQDKEQLGELLYGLVEKRSPDNAAKITGMILEMEIGQIQAIVRDTSQLDKWISEAKKVRR